MTDTNDEWFHETVTFRYETDVEIPTSETFDVTVEQRTEYDNWDDPTIAEILEEALEIVYSAPAFDWVDSDILYQIDLEDIEGIDVITTDGQSFVLEEIDEHVRVTTVSSGVVHEINFTKTVDGELMTDEMIQGGESYRIGRTDLPEWLIDDLEERYGEIIE